MILKAPSKNIMNKLARSVLALYSYDDECENKGLDNEMRTAISLIAKLPVIMANAYQVKRRSYDNASMIMRPINYEENTAQTILSLSSAPTGSIPRKRRRCWTFYLCFRRNMAAEITLPSPAVFSPPREPTPIQPIHRLSTC